MRETLHGEQEKLGWKVILFGIAGLIVVAWGLFPYISGIFDFLNSGKSAPTQATADYSAVGQSGQAKTLAPPPAPTGSSTTPDPKGYISVKSAVPKLPFTIPPFNGAQWIYDWGSASITADSLTFGAATSSTGGDLFLASSSAWTNYTVQANVDWQAGSSFGIIARLADGKNFVYCDFSNKMAEIVLRTNGDDTVIAQADTLVEGAASAENLGVSVYGNSVACVANGSEVLGADIPQNEPSAGGIGLISWDPTPGVSKISVNNLTVTPLASNTIAAPFPVPAPVAAKTATTSTVIAPAAASPQKLELPYLETNFTNEINWKQTWGTVATDTSNFLEIGSAANTSGGSTILSNTDNWLNYKMVATVDWMKGETFMAVARNVDSNNYVGCEFIKDPATPGAVTIQLEKFVNGNQAILQTGEDTNFSHEGNTNIAVSISVQDSNASCSFNNHAISNAGGNSYGISPIAGTIGFSTWDPTLGNTLIVVKQVSVASNY